MTTTKTNTNRCYILSKEDLTANKKLKKLFSPLHLHEIAPSGSGLPKIEGMHYYMTDKAPEGNPVKKKSLEKIGSSIREHEQLHNEASPFPVQDEIDKMPLDEVVAELCSDKKPKQTKEDAAAMRKAPWKGFQEHSKVDYADDEDLSFEEILAIIGGRSPAPKYKKTADKKAYVPSDDKDTAEDEVLSSLGTVIKPSPRPTQKDIDANPKAYVSISRAALAPFFGEDTPDEVVEMIILAVLAINRIHELEMKAAEKKQA